MRILILALLIGLAFTEIASAEYAQVGCYNVSFTLDRPHEVNVSTFYENKYVSIKTFDGPVDIIIWGNQTSTYKMYDATVGNTDYVDSITVDGDNAFFIIAPYGRGDRNIYSAIYRIDDKVGENCTVVRITSELSLDNTIDFLRSLHIESDS